MCEPEEGWDVLTIETLKARYLQEGERNWEDICERMAKAIATTEEESIEFRDLMIRNIFRNYSASPKPVG